MRWFVTDPRCYSKEDTALCLRQARRDFIGPLPGLCGLNINPHDARGAFQQCLDSVMGQMMGAFGPEIVSLADLERDKKRYADALAVLHDPLRTVFTLVLLPERLHRQAIRACP